MPTGKRASMREGPLAALFRKTTEDTAPGGEAAAKPTPEEQSVVARSGSQSAGPRL